MTATTFYVSLLLVWCVLYLVLPGWLISRGQFLSAGLVQLLGAVLPSVWQGIFWPNEAGNFGLLIMMLVPIPLCIIAGASVALLARGAKWVFRAAQH